MSVLGELARLGESKFFVGSYAQLAKAAGHKESGKQFRRVLAELTKEGDTLISISPGECGDGSCGYTIVIPDDVVAFMSRLREMDHIGFCPGDDPKTRINEMFGPGGWALFERLRRLGQLQEQQIELDRGGVYTMYVIP